MFSDFWEAPGRLWRPKVRQLEDVEIDAVLVSSRSPQYHLTVLISGPYYRAAVLH